MSKYLELFLDSFDDSIIEKTKPENKPYVAYSIKEGKVVYTMVPAKDEESDSVAGYVDLGLSVMWASCNLGASNPEELGETYKWGETDEHKSGENEYTEYPNLVEHSYSKTYDAVTVSMKDNPYVKYIHYRIPTAELWQELIDNTTREVYTNGDGRNICKYTSNINGNFILLPLLMQAEGNEEIYYKTTTPSSHNGSDSQNSTVGKIIRIYSKSGTTSVVSDFNDAKGEPQNNYVRGVCSYPPKVPITQYGDNVSSDSTFVLTSAHSIEITCPEDFTVYFSTTPDFAPDSTDENVVGFYKAQKHGDNYDRQISCKELEFGQSKHDYLYVRFVCNSATTMTQNMWNISPCVAQSILISSGEQFSNSLLDEALYRIAYKDWASAGMTISWSQRGSLPIHLSSFCDFKITDPQKVDILSVPARGTLKITQDKVDSWSSSIDENGFLYIRFNSIRKGDITFTSSKPAETDLDT
jgi:hypothetical protein